MDLATAPFMCVPRPDGSSAREVRRTEHEECILRSIRDRRRRRSTVRHSGLNNIAVLVECGNGVTRPSAVSSIIGESASPDESAFAASVTPTRAVAPWAPEVTTDHDWFENASPKWEAVGV